MEKKETKATSTKKETFDNLAHGITEDERKELLEHIGQNQADAGGEVLFATKQKRTGPDETEKQEFSFRLKQESILKKLFMWVQSMLTASSVEDVYNHSVLKRIARRVEVTHPDLILYRRRVLYNQFYEKLQHLKKAADFFRPYLTSFEKNPGQFYVSLGNMVMPELKEQILAKADPYSFPFDHDLSKEEQQALHQKMLDVLATLSDGRKKEMYRYAQQVVWLDNLVSLPLAKMLSKFSEVDGKAKECLFSLMRPEFSKLASLFCAYTTISGPVIDILLVSTLSMEGWEDNLDDIPADGDKLHAQADVQLGLIKMLVDTMPMEDLAKLVFDNALYEVLAKRGGDDWSERFTERWKALFARRLTNWQADVKKEKLKVKLHDYFAMDAFPLFPLRPWTKVWNGLPFQHELSLGLIYHFMKTHSEEFASVFKGIALEGEFAVKDNQREFSELVDKFNNLMNELEVLATELASTGEYGMELERYKDIRMRTEAAIKQVNWIMCELESDALAIQKEFARLSYRMMNMLNGFLSDKYSGRFATIMNLRDIQRSQGDFRERVIACRQGFIHIYEIMQQVEILEDPDAAKNT